MTPKLLCPINPFTIPLFKGVLQKTKEILGTSNWTPYFESINFLFAYEYCFYNIFLLTDLPQYDCKAHKYWARGEGGVALIPPSASNQTMSIMSRLVSDIIFLMNSNFFCDNVASLCNGVGEPGSQSR